MFGFLPPVLAIRVFLPRTTVFIVESSMDITPWTLVYLVEIYEHMLPCTPVILVETSVHVILQAYVHILPKSSLLVILCVCFSVHMLPRSSVHMPPQAPVLMVAVLCVCLSFCPTIFIRWNESSCYLHFSIIISSHFFVLTLFPLEVCWA